VGKRCIFRLKRMINNNPIMKDGSVSAAAVAPLMARSKKEPGLTAVLRPMTKPISTASTEPYPASKRVTGSLSMKTLIAGRWYTMD
jgi:hypothetical protein